MGGQPEHVGYLLHEEPSEPFLRQLVVGGSVLGEFVHEY